MSRDRRKLHKAWGNSVRDRRNKDFRRVLLRASDACGICGLKIEVMGDASLDHIIPLSKGGKDVPSNMQIAHVTCNQTKGDSQ